ncbi:MAG: ParB N-terminal domain-containing protein [Thermoguttaceae bacterium]|nr:ParB N-terminal domain-containing protein [Thermoguttaceae bacterium]
MKIENLKLSEIKPYEKNPRRNDAAVNGVAESIRQFGFRQPLVIDANGVIVVGHTRYKAAKKLGLKTVPCVRADDLDETKIAAYRLADNKLNEIADWDVELLEEILPEIDFDFASLDIDFSDLELSESDDAPREKATNVNIPENFQLIVTCQTEEEQKELFDELLAKGFDCKVFVF